MTPVSWWLHQRPSVRIVGRVQRAPGILWRLAGDRVMTHRIDAPPATAAHDLIGPVALVWVALDQPAARGELSARLADAELTIDDLDAEIDHLLAAGLVVETAAEVLP